MNRQEPASDDWSWQDPVEADEFFMKEMPWQEMSPGLYAARYSHQIYCYSYEHMRFRNPQIDRWARRLGELLRDSNELQRIRREYLTPKEYRQVMREMAQCRRDLRKLEREGPEAEQKEDRPGGTLRR